MKTWVDLLGTDTHNCFVDDDMIVRQTAPNGVCRVLWKFDKAEYAQASFRQWIEECCRKIEHMSLNRTFKLAYAILNAFKESSLYEEYLEDECITDEEYQTMLDNLHDLEHKS